MDHLSPETKTAVLTAFNRYFQGVYSQLRNKKSIKKVVNIGLPNVTEKVRSIPVKDIVALIQATLERRDSIPNQDLASYPLMPRPVLSVPANLITAQKKDSANSPASQPIRPAGDLRDKPQTRSSTQETVAANASSTVNDVPTLGASALNVPALEAPVPDAPLPEAPELDAPVLNVPALNATHVRVSVLSPETGSQDRFVTKSTAFDIDEKGSVEVHASHMERPDLPLPSIINHAVLCEVQQRLEACCYDVAERHVPHVLQEKGWDAAEAVELSWWQPVFAKNKARLSAALVRLESPSGLKAKLAAASRIRHDAVHREPQTLKSIFAHIETAEALMADLDDQPRLSALVHTKSIIETELERWEGRFNAICERHDKDIAKIQARRLELDELEKHVNARFKESKEQLHNSTKVAIIGGIQDPSEWYLDMRIYPYIVAAILVLMLGISMLLQQKRGVL